MSVTCKQAVDAAEIHERAVIGDVLDHAVDDLASSRFCTSSWRCSARVSSSTVRRETTMLPRRRSILRIWNGCGAFISGVTSRIGRMSTCERGRNATAPSRSTVKPPLTWLKMDAVTFSLFLNAVSSLPQLSSRRALSRDSTASPSAFSTRSR
jgi:hypothetical protein